MTNTVTTEAPQSELEALRAEFDAFKRKVMEIGARAKEESGWCEPGYNAAMEQLGLPKIQTYRVPVKFKMMSEDFIFVSSDSVPEGARPTLAEIKEYSGHDVTEGEYEVESVRYAVQVKREMDLNARVSAVGQDEDEARASITKETIANSYGCDSDKILSFEIQPKPVDGKVSREDRRGRLRERTMQEGITEPCNNVDCDVCFEEPNRPRYRRIG